VSRFIVPLIVFAATGLLLSIGGMVMVLSRGPDTAGHAGRFVQDHSAIGLSVPEFTLVDQDGTTRTHQLFEDRITILDFMFTHCPFACPGMTMAMSDLARRLEGTGVQFVSISVDPARDTPEQLKAYAVRNGVDTSRWHFLTGDLGTIEKIAVQSLQFLVQPDERTMITLPDGSEMANVIHPTKFILVGPGREVLGFYESSFPEDLDELAIRARSAAASLKR
jgi:protein SCO1